MIQGYDISQTVCRSQINRSPSFGTDEKLDYDIKSALVHDTVKLLNIRFGPSHIMLFKFPTLMFVSVSYRLNDRKRSIQQQKMMTHRRLIRHQKRLDVTLDDKDRKVVSLERRKEELVS